MKATVKYGEGKKHNIPLVPRCCAGFVNTGFVCNASLAQYEILDAGSKDVNTTPVLIWTTGNSASAMTSDQRKTCCSHTRSCGWWKKLQTTVLVVVCASVIRKFSKPVQNDGDRMQIEHMQLGVPAAGSR